MIESEEAISMAREIIRREAIFAGMSSGAALLAAEPWRLPALARWCAAATLVPVAEDPGFHADYLRHMRFGV